MESLLSLHRSRDQPSRRETCRPERTKLCSETSISAIIICFHVIGWRCLNKQRRHNLSTSLNNVDITCYCAVIAFKHKTLFVAETMTQTREKKSSLGKQTQHIHVLSTITNGRRNWLDGLHPFKLCRSNVKGEIITLYDDRCAGFRGEDCVTYLHLFLGLPISRAARTRERKWRDGGTLRGSRCGLRTALYSDSPKYTYTIKQLRPKVRCRRKSFLVCRGIQTVQKRVLKAPMSTRVRVI